jgi:hypothetical protein
VQAVSMLTTPLIFIRSYSSEVSAKPRNSASMAAADAPARAGKLQSPCGRRAAKKEGPMPVATRVRPSKPCRRVPRPDGGGVEGCEAGGGPDNGTKKDMNRATKGCGYTVRRGPTQYRKR